MGQRIPNGVRVPYTDEVPFNLIPIEVESDKGCKIFCDYHTVRRHQVVIVAGQQGVKIVEFHTNVIATTIAIVKRQIKAHHRHNAAVSHHAQGMGIATSLAIVDGLVPQQFARRGEFGYYDALPSWTARFDDIRRKEPFAAQLGIRRELAEDIEVARRVDARADNLVGCIATAYITTCVGPHPLESLSTEGIENEELRIEKEDKN
ncbi:MAG: hypothetical protein IKG81_06940 [Bacteroidales bacterium]|nr:hypothetical protein [Bacteroidales bacterium]